jgi:hypothetical protein
VDWILLMSKQRRPLLFSIYAIVHTITLVMVTIALLLNAMPAPIVSAMPLYLQQMRYTEELEKNTGLTNVDLASPYSPPVRPVWGSR